MDIISYSLSKKIAASAVSGVNSMSVSGQTLTINTKDSGVLTMTFPTPKDGISVTDIDVNANNQIVFTMSDGTEYISGVIPTVKGDKGNPGENGSNGKSAYEIAKDNGFVGTETEWLESLKGTDGLDGKDFEYSDFTTEQLEALKVKGDNGVSPTITENADNTDNTDKIYKLDITTADATFTTPNLKGKDGSGSEGGEANVIDSISVNGVNVEPDVNKNVDITIPSLDGYAKTSELPTKVSQLENDNNYLTSIPEEYITETELDAKGYLTEHQDISNLVEKEDGKGLSSNDYTTEEKEKLAGLENYDDTSLSGRVKTIEDDYVKSADIPTKVSELTNDSNYQTAEQVNSTVTTEIAKVVADAPEDLNTLKEMSDWIAGHEDDASAMNSAISDNKTAITALQTGKADKNDLVDKADKSYVDNNLGELSTKTTSTIVKTNATLLYLGAKQLGIEPTDNFYIFKITAFCEDGYNISLTKYKHGVTLLVKTISNSKTTITATNQVGTITYSGTLKCAYVEYIGVADESVDFGSGRDVTELATMDKIASELADHEYKLIGTGTVGSVDCNDFYEFGNYTTYLAYAPTNRPTGSDWGYYETISHSDTGYAKQTCKPLIGNKIYIRTLWNGTWGNWTELASVDKIDDLNVLGWVVPDKMSVRNYKNSDNVFYQKVARVNLSNFTWTYDSANKFWYSTNTVLNNMKLGMNISFASDYSMTSLWHNEENIVRLYTQSTSSPSGYLYYELAEANAISIYGNEIIAKMNNSLGGLSFSVSGTNLVVTDGTNTWTIAANS